MLTLDVSEGWQAPGLPAQRPRPSAPPSSAGHSSNLLLGSLSSCAQDGCQEHIIAYVIHCQQVKKGTTSRNFEKGKEATSPALPTSPAPSGTPHLQGCVSSHPEASRSTVGSGRGQAGGCRAGRWQLCPPQKMSRAGLSSDHRTYIHSCEGPCPER